MTINEVLAEIARLNDEFRKVETFYITQGLFLTKDISGLVQAVRDYTDFTEDNDPYGEHDFGSLDWDGEKVFVFKKYCTISIGIVYYLYRDSNISVTREL